MPSVILLMLALAGAWIAPPARAFSLYLASGGAKTGDHSRAAAALVNAFKVSHPDASIELDVSTSYLRGITETLMQNLGNRTPDVAIVGLDEWPILLKHGKLRRLETVLDKAALASLWRGFLTEATVQAYGTGVEARAYALPFNRGLPALYFDAGLLHIPAAARLSWTDLSQYLETAQAANPERKESLHVAIPLDDWVTEALFVGTTGEPTLTGKLAHYNTLSAKVLIELLRRMRDSGELVLVPSQHDAFEAFVSRRAAAALMSTSAYAGLASRAKFEARITLPPDGGKHAVNTGGGDLILPDNPSQKPSAKSLKDIGEFLRWFYGGEGAAVWAAEASMSPLVKAAAKSEAYRSRMQRQPDLDEVLRNTAKWTVTSFYRLDEYCDILKVRQAAVRTFENALTGPDPSDALAQADQFMDKLLATPNCP